jgi:hypothetical protein
MTKQQAKKLCLIKWRYVVDTGCDYYDLSKWLYSNHPNIRNLNDSCAYCTKYKDMSDKTTQENCCEKCPLKKENKSCFDNSSFFRKWDKAINKTTKKKYAKLLYEAIERS